MSRSTEANEGSRPSRPEGRQRALAELGSTVGGLRGAMYKRAFSRINHANDAGYYLESITIIESLVSDRLESRLSFLLQRNFSFRTLGASIQTAGQVEPDPELKTIILEGVNEWRKKRNTALHEMAKMADGDDRAWEEKYAELEQIASDGLSVLSRLQDRMRKIKRASASASS